MMTALDAFTLCPQLVHLLCVPAAVMWMQDKNKTAGWRPIVKRQPFPQVASHAALCWLPAGCACSSARPWWFCAGCAVLVVLKCWHTGAEPCIPSAAHMHKPRIATAHPLGSRFGLIFRGARPQRHHLQPHTDGPAPSSWGTPCRWASACGGRPRRRRCCNPSRSASWSTLGESLVNFGWVLDSCAQGPVGKGPRPACVPCPQGLRSPACCTCVPPIPSAAAPLLPPPPPGQRAPPSVPRNQPARPPLHAPHPSTHPHTHAATPCLTWRCRCLRRSTCLASTGQMPRSWCSTRP